MILKSHSLPLSRALEISSQDADFHQSFARVGLPECAISLGEGEMHQKVRVLPFSWGTPGQTFKFRLVGWTRAGKADANVVWVGMPLVVLNCTIGEVAGPVNANPYSDQSLAISKRVLLPVERMCDYLEVIYGSLLNGPTVGFQYSGYAAHALVGTDGCHAFSFEFASDQNIAMNALWALA